jgi:hypothetical protein
MDEMIAKSTAIVRGRVAGSYAAFRGAMIYTHLQVQVLERWKGPDTASVEVLVPGGTASGSRQAFSGAPKLLVGKEYLLFLWTGGSGVTHIIGFTQGLFELPKSAAGEQLAVRAATTETMLDRATGRPVADQPLRMLLRDLSARIHRSVAGGRGR